MKRKLTAVGIVLALASYIVLILASRNVLAFIGLVAIVLLAIGLTSKAITALIERRQRHTVTYWEDKIA